MGVLTTCCVSSKRIAEKFTPIMLFDISIGRLQLRYQNMEVLDECDDPNAIHRWNRFKREVIKKPNYYKNHFRLTEKKQELLETAWMSLFKTI